MDLHTFFIDRGAVSVGFVPHRKIWEAQYVICCFVFLILHIIDLGPKVERFTETLFNVWYVW